MYQVLARKWRPKSFEELVGQPHVSRTLANAIQGERIAHAYIFAGQRGTGKTSVARILAKCLNCEQGPTPTPCNSCTPCSEISEGRAIDVLEIDAASRTGVDDIRELQEVIAYPPVRDRNKLLIIDEAHMLSKQAFNALLKTLEEPPPRVVFVLATTEIQKVLPTILSRCQVLEFRRVTPKEVGTHLRKLSDEEQIEISDLSLGRIARAGEGSVRDSLSVLERVLAWCGRSVDDEEVLRVLGAVRAESLAGIVGAMARRDAAGMLSVLDGLVDEGHDLVHFWGELIGVLRDLLLLRTARRDELLSRSADEAQALAAAAEELSLEDLSRIFQIVADLETPLKTSSQPRYLFEAMLIKLSSLGAVRPIEEVLASLGTATDRAPRPARPQKKKLDAPRTDRPLPEREAPVQDTAPTVSQDLPPGPGPAPLSSELAARLKCAVHDARPMLGALLDEAASIRLEDDRLSVAFPSDRTGLRRQLERKDNRELLAGCAQRITGRTPAVVVSCDTETDADATVAVRPAEPGLPTRPSPPSPAAAAREAGPSGAASPQDRRSLTRQAFSDPGTEMLLREFGAQIVDIRPLEARPSPVAEGAEEPPPNEPEEFS